MDCLITSTSVSMRKWKWIIQSMTRILTKYLNTDDMDEDIEEDFDEDIDF